jgi:hypothetical protein
MESEAEFTAAKPVTTSLSILGICRELRAMVSYVQNTKVHQATEGSGVVSFSSFLIAAKFQQKMVAKDVAASAFL